MAKEIPIVFQILGETLILKKKVFVASQLPSVFDLFVFFFLFLMSLNKCPFMGPILTWL